MTSNSKPKSRWADADADDHDHDEDEVRRKKDRDRDQKRRVKAEKVAAAAATAARQLQPPPLNGTFVSDERQQQPPAAKRRRTSASASAAATEPQADEEQEQEQKEGAHILPFPSSGLNSCRDVSLFEVLNSIEEGSYGFVSRARKKADGEVVALKKLKLENTKSEGFPVTGLREIQTLRACRGHRHVVNLQEVVTDSENLQDVYLVLDFIEHDLKTLLEDNPEPFLPSETKTLMFQIVSATAYLHENYILHRDLKTSNLLLNNRGEVKLADFGMARYVSHPPPPSLTQLVVTLWYRAPELLLGTVTYDFGVDIWSVGCIFAELVTRDPLFQGKNEVDQLSLIFSLLGTPTRESWPDFRSLPNAKALHPVLSKTAAAGPKTSLPAKFPYLTNSGIKLLLSLLALNPASRPTAADVLKHLYFTEENPRPKPPEMFPTFPSRAGQERKKRKKATPNAPGRGDKVPVFSAGDFAGVFGQDADTDGEGEEVQKGAGFALRLG